MPTTTTRIELRQPAANHERQIAKTAYEIARNALSEQHESVRDLRTRTGALLAATSVVVSFLGARALTTVQDRSLALAGLGVFVFSLLFCLYVLLPTRKIESLAQGGVLFDMALSRPDPVTQTYRRLAATCDTIAAANEPQIERLGRVFTLACGDSRRGPAVGTAASASMTVMPEKPIPRPAPPEPIKEMMKPEPGAILGGRGKVRR